MNKMTYQHEREIIDILKTTNEALQEMASLLFQIRDRLEVMQDTMKGE